MTADLETVLKTNARVQTEKELYIRADEQAHYGVVARAVAAARAAGVTSLNLLVSPEVEKALGKKEGLDRCAELLARSRSRSALLVALFTQVGGLALLGSGGGTALRADISDERARPMSVAITPIVDDAPLLKLGTKKQPGKLPDRWIAPRAVERAAAASASLTSRRWRHPKRSRPRACPTQVRSRLERRTISPSRSTFRSQAVEAGPAPVSTVEGAADGVKEGTETDPLKAHIISEYKARLDQFFASRFQMRGKLPFDVLKTLRAVAVVNISADRTVTGFTITKPSGNATFDDELRSTLSTIVANGTDCCRPLPHPICSPPRRPSHSSARTGALANDIDDP